MLQAREAAKRAALNALKRARRTAEKTGVDLSDWEGEFIGSLEERIKTYGRAFGDPGVRPIWFAQMIQSALVATVTDAYADFGTLGGFVGYVVLSAIKGDVQLKGGWPSR